MLPKGKEDYAYSSVSTTIPPEIVSARSKRQSKTAAVEAQGRSENNLTAGLKRERIASLAYKYWLERGCQGGSPEEDWFRAEREIDLASWT